RRARFSHPARMTCSICLDFFRDLVMVVGCGHNFCRAFITQCWEGAKTDVTCPQQLGNLVELVKGLSVRPAEAAGGQRVCGEHGEALKLFCQDDEIPICVVCDRSRAHRAYNVVPLEEAVEEYKGQILLLHISQGEGYHPGALGFAKNLPSVHSGLCWCHLSVVILQKWTRAEKQKILSKFHQLRQLLQEQEQLLLAQLGQLEKEVANMQKEKGTKLSEEISHLNLLICEMESKFEQPDSEFLQVRLGMAPSAPGLGSVLMLQFSLPVMVTLDPDPAHPKLILSADGRSVTLAGRRQHLPDNPERFDFESFVLGREELSWGRHYREVKMDVDEGNGWGLDVARDTVRRKGEIKISPKEGFWGVLHWWGNQIQVLTASAPTCVHLPQEPSRVRVCLHYAEGLVSFFDADTETPIFTFPPASFTGDRIRPWFCLRLQPMLRSNFDSGQLRLRP
uniref:Uncharacterized protein n=1 Tax=Crocodylus porosus TaxID=8502 RepID=A0A7M4ED58_CROPO